MTAELIPPSEDASDHVYTVVRGLIGSVPGFGSIGVELLHFIATPSLERRSRKWQDSVALRLMDLMRSVEDIQAELERLQSDERFVSTLVQASRIAVTTHSQEKLEALRNAVLNVANGIDVDEVERQIFLRYVDELTELHLRILAYGDGSVRPSELNYGGWPDVGVGRILSTVFPDLSLRELLVPIVWDELSDRGLVFPVKLNERPSSLKWRDKWTTDFGRHFLQFINHPNSDQKPD